MASSRFASAITLSAGAKTNSASLSTNFLMSQGQATRSTLTCSRVIHFMGLLLWIVTSTVDEPCKTQSLSPSSRIDKHRGTMGLRQKRIDFVSGPIERQRVGTRLRRHNFLPT